MNLRYLLNPISGSPSHQPFPSLDHPRSPNSRPPSPVFADPPSPEVSAITDHSQRPPHSNLRYTQGELDCIRYLHEDLGLSWNEVQMAYNRQFPPARHRSVMGLHSRYYREQTVRVSPAQLEGLEGAPAVGGSFFAAGAGAFSGMQAQFFDDEMVVRQENGDIFLRHRIRDRDTNEGREIRQRFGVCYRLVDVAPARLLAYDWPVIRECDREAAYAKLDMGRGEEECVGKEKGRARL